MGGIEFMSIFYIAFFAALGHCVGMCGGIVIAVSARMKPNSNIFTKGFYHFLYSSGRTTTYMILGAICGHFGTFLSMNMSLKIYSSMLISSILMIFGFAIIFMPKLLNIFEPSVSTNGLFGRLFKKALLSNSNVSTFLLGLLNGALPCGIVYYFLLSASIGGSWLNGALTMFVFGLATIPVMMLFGVVSASLISYRKIFLYISGVSMIGFALFSGYKAFMMIQ